MKPGTFVKFKFYYVLASDVISGESCLLEFHSGEEQYIFVPFEHLEPTPLGENDENIRLLPSPRDW